MQTTDNVEILFAIKELSLVLTAIEARLDSELSRLSQLKSQRKSNLDQLKLDLAPNLSRSTLQRLTDLDQGDGQRLISPVVSSAFNDSGLVFGFWPGPLYRRNLAFVRVHLATWLDAQGYGELSRFNADIVQSQRRVTDMDAQRAQLLDTLARLQSAVAAGVQLPQSQIGELNQYVANVRSYRTQPLCAPVQTNINTLEIFDDSDLWIYALTEFPTSTRTYLIDVLTAHHSQGPTAIFEQSADSFPRVAQDSSSDLCNPAHDVPDPPDPFVNTSGDRQSDFGAAAVGACVAYGIATDDSLGAYS